MSFVAPLALILIPPLALMAWLLVGGRVRLADRLPGAWNGLVDGRLKRYLADRAGNRRNHAPFLMLGLVAVIVLAIARPGFHGAGQPDLTGIAGRVVILDASTDISQQAVFLRELEEANPSLPTAVVAVGEDAYLITPFTTDAAQTHRYLNVLTPEMIPGEGRRLHLGLAMAEKVLARARLPVGQIILISDAPPPAPIAIDATETIRTVAALGPGDWRAFADLYDAEVIGGSAAAGASSGLLDRARAEVAATLPGQRFDLTPVLISAAALAWLLLFRRRLS